MENAECSVSPADSHDWEWCPKEMRCLPKGKKIESQNSIASLNAISGTGGSMTEACVEPGWRINDILLAAKVLQNARPTPSYANEAEMRRVFGLVYDVLRCELLVLEHKKNLSLFHREILILSVLQTFQTKTF